MVFTLADRKGNKINVEAFESATPRLLITMCWEDAEYLAHRTTGEPNIRAKWHVTHQGTGMKLTDPAVSKRAAKLIAGALGGLPLDWAIGTQEEMYSAVTSHVTDKALRFWLTHTLRNRG